MTLEEQVAALIAEVRSLNARFEAISDGFGDSEEWNDVGWLDARAWISEKRTEAKKGDNNA